MLNRIPYIGDAPGFTLAKLGGIISAGNSQVAGAGSVTVPAAAKYVRVTAHGGGATGQGPSGGPYGGPGGGAFVGVFKVTPGEVVSFDVAAATPATAGAGLSGNTTTLSIAGQLVASATGGNQAGLQGGSGVLTTYGETRAVSWAAFRGGSPTQEAEGIGAGIYGGNGGNADIYRGCGVAGPMTSRANQAGNGGSAGTSGGGDGQPGVAPGGGGGAGAGGGSRPGGGGARGDIFWEFFG